MKKSLSPQGLLSTRSRPPRQSVHLFVLVNSSPGISDFSLETLHSCPHPPSLRGCAIYTQLHVLLSTLLCTYYPADWSIWYTKAPSSFSTVAQFSTMGAGQILLKTYGQQVVSNLVTDVCLTALAHLTAVC